MDHARVEGAPRQLARAVDLLQEAARRVAQEDIGPQAVEDVGAVEGPLAEAVLRPPAERAGVGATVPEVAEELVIGLGPVAVPGRRSG